MESAKRLGADFVTYAEMPGEEPLLVVRCLPRKVGMGEAFGQVTQGPDEGPLVHGVAGGVQDPLPGLETPPCQ